MSAGKGDARRPYDAKRYAENFDRIFRKPKDKHVKKQRERMDKRRDAED